MTWLRAQPFLLQCWTTFFTSLSSLTQPKGVLVQFVVFFLPTRIFWVLLLKGFLFRHTICLSFTHSPSLQNHTHTHTILCTAQSCPPLCPASREPRGRYKLRGGTIKSYNVYHCETPKEIKVVLLVELRCNLKPCLLARSSFPRRMDVRNGWVFKLCSHKEKSLVPMRPLWNSITHVSLVHGSNHTLTLIRDCVCVMSKMLFSVRQEWIQGSFG